MPKAGVEPARPFGHCALNAARLPIPPLRHCEKYNQKSSSQARKNSKLSCTTKGLAYIKKVPKEEVKVIATNKKAYKDYFLLESHEAGIALTGTEVKSVRARKVNFKDSFARVKNGEVYLLNLHISPYEQGNRYNVDPERTRKLLLHRKQIDRLLGKTQEKGLTLVPTKIYIKEGLVKVEIALGKGKRFYDKREEIKKEQAKRDLQRFLKDKK